MKKVIGYQRLVLIVPCLFIVIFLLSGCGGGGGGGIPVPTYTVTYNGNGNTSGSVPIDTTNYLQGQIVTVLGNTGNLVNTGYFFSGWNTQSDGLGTTYLQAQTFTIGAANVTLYAKWTANPIITSFIISDPVVDGDIAVNSSGTTTTITQGAQSVFAGIDSVNTEFRAFLDFPLTGSGGVPGNAIIDSAFLDILIDNVSLSSGNTIPIRIDLVSFPPPNLIGTDFDRNQQPPLASITLNIFTSDIGRHVNVDVTSLMTVAQNNGLADFQIRILEDFGNFPAGLIEIDDTTGVNRGDLAPFLSVNYF